MQRADWLELKALARAARIQHERKLAMCVGKQGFALRADAEHSARHFANAVSIYRCPNCHNWHVGRNQQGRKR